MSINIRSEQKCYGGVQGFYSHQSTATGTEMNFSVYQPPQVLSADKMQSTAVPALYYLAGLTCTEETFIIKAGAQRLAAKLGLALVTCDTSPRGLGYEGEDDDWDFGTGAGFYLNATAKPWQDGYQMGQYVQQELPELIEANFPVITGQRGIFGHSMGGHGALVTALREPDRWQSVSAFAPICNPMQVPWGQKAFSNYLGDNQQDWQAWDATELLKQQTHPRAILIDQGLDDQFLAEQLSPEVFHDTAKQVGQAIELRLHAGYDHSYYFIQSFIRDHMRHHAHQLIG